MPPHSKCSEVGLRTLKSPALWDTQTSGHMSSTHDVKLEGHSIWP